jgi:hypothetical protein
MLPPILFFVFQPSEKEIVKERWPEKDNDCQGRQNVPYPTVFVHQKVF